MSFFAEDGEFLKLRKECAGESVGVHFQAAGSEEQAKTAYSSLADRHYPTGALTLHAAGPPDNGKEQAAELSIDEVAPRL
jgi:hypothetical protein